MSNLHYFALHTLKKSCDTSNQINNVLFKKDLCNKKYIIFLTFLQGSMNNHNETESISNSTNTTSIRKYFMEKFENPNITECRPTILMTELQVKTSGNCKSWQFKIQSTYMRIRTKSEPMLNTSQQS